eukprot:4069743-Prymnesium_polylepis.4
MPCAFVHVVSCRGPCVCAALPPCAPTGAQVLARHVGVVQRVLLPPLDAAPRGARRRPRADAAAGRGEAGGGRREQLRLGNLGHEHGHLGRVVHAQGSECREEAQWLGDVQRRLARAGRRRARGT